MECGKLLAEGASLVAGGVGAVKSGALLTEKITAKLVKEGVGDALTLGSKKPFSIYHQRLIKNAEVISTAKPSVQFTAPRNLNEQVLWNLVIDTPSLGQPLKGMNKNPCFPTDAGFHKMQATHQLPDGSHITIHYQYNLNAGKAYDIKITSPERENLQPSNSIVGVN